MKNLILGIALIGLAVGCKNNENNQVSDASAIEAPAGDCAGCPADMCDDAAKASCEGMSGCDMKADAGCDMKADADCATECNAADAKVCPITGEVQN